MKLIVDSLLGPGSDSEQSIMIVSGLGGSGKTQIALKFARDYENR
jgi:Mrp family chromosome partitioning ATPase